MHAMPARNSNPVKAWMHSMAAGDAGSAQWNLPRKPERTLAALWQKI
jgi:hypothetical protein